MCKISIVTIVVTIAVLVFAAGCKCPCKKSTMCPVPQKTVAVNR